MTGQRSPQDDHYHYTWIHDRDRAPRPPWRVVAVVNAGHTGSGLNCPHPACQAARVPLPGPPTLTGAPRDS